MVDIPFGGTLVPLIVGTPVAKIEHVSTESLLDSAVPVADSASDRLGNSTFLQGSTEMECRQNLQLPRMVGLGENVRFNAVGEFFIIQDPTNPGRFVTTPFETVLEGVGATVMARTVFQAPVTEVVQSDDSQTLGNFFTITVPGVPGTGGALVSSYTFRFANSLNAVTGLIRRGSLASDPVIYEADFAIDVTAGQDAVFTFTDRRFGFLAGTTYRIEFTSVNGTPQLLGNSGGIAYYARTAQAFGFTQLMDASNVVTTLEALTADARLDYNALKNLPTIPTVPAVVGSERFTLNANNADGNRLDPGDIVYAVGSQTTSNIDYVQVAQLRGALSSLPEPIGIVNTEIGNGNNELESITVTGSISITQAGLTLNDEDPIYLQVSGSGSTESWIFSASATNNVLVGKVLSVTNQGAGQYDVFLDFSAAFAIAQIPSSVGTDTGVHGVDLNARNETSSTISEGAIVWPGQRNINDNISYTNVGELNVAQLSPMPRPAGIAVVGMAPAARALRGIRTRGLVEFTQAGLVLTNEAPIYAEPTGSGASERWQYSASPGDNNVLIGRMVQIINSGAGTYQGWFDFAAGQADGLLKPEVERTQDIVGAMVVAGSHVDISPTYDDANGELDLALLPGRFGRVARPSDYSGQATTNLVPGNQVGPGSTSRFIGTSSGSLNNTVFLTGASSTDHIGYWWMFHNDSPNGTQQIIDAVGSTNRVNGGNSVALPAGSVALVRVRDYNEGTSFTDFEVFTWTRPAHTGGMIGSGGAGGASGLASLFFENLNQPVVNRTGALIRRGEPVVIGIDATNDEVVVEPAGFGTPDGFMLNDIAADAGSTGDMLVIGTVLDVTIPIHDNASTAELVEPIASDTQIYWDNAESRYDINEAAVGSTFRTGLVAASDYFLPNTPPNMTGTVSITDQTTLDTYLNNTVIKGSGIGSIDFVLPLIGEGASLNDSVQQGDGFAIVVPLGAGTMSIDAPVGQGFVDDSDVAVPSGEFGMTGGANSEGMFVFRDGDNWKLSPLNRRIIRTSIHFRTDSNNLRQLQTVALQNSTAINSLNSPRYQSIADNSNPLSFSTIRDHVEYNPSQDNRIVRMPNVGALTALNASTYADFFLRNNSDFWLRVETFDQVSTFRGTSTPFFYLKPRETRQFRWIKDTASTGFVEPIGPIEYDFIAESSLLSPIDWSIVGSDGIVADLINDAVAGQAGRLQFELACTLRELRLSVDWAFTGTAAADFASLLVRTPGVDLQRNDVTVEAGNDVAVINLTGATANHHHEFNPVAMTAGQYLGLSGVDLTDVVGTSIRLRGKMIVKAA
jgi:hypothetical protein